MALRELLRRTSELYPDYKAESHVRGLHPAYQAVTEDIPDALRSLAGDGRPYKFQGSTGVGNVTPAPWIAVFDRAVTESAQSGYYFVYLFSIDLSRVYACLALGVTEFELTYGKNQRMLRHLDQAALGLASRLDLGPRYVAGNIDLAATRPTQLHGLYEHSSIVSVRYETGALPSDQVLQSDLLGLPDYYDQLRRDVGPTETRRRPSRKPRSSQVG